MLERFLQVMRFSLLLCGHGGRFVSIYRGIMSGRSICRIAGSLCRRRLRICCCRRFGRRIGSGAGKGSYDISLDDLADLETQRELDESYGWFSVEAICRKCRKVVCVISYECT